MFNRGFKAWCENVALQHRRELKLKPLDPLPPRGLAQLLDVPGLDARSLSVLLNKDPDSWSAVTLSGGPKNLVLLLPVRR